MKKGIDVSSYQQVIDWNTARDYIDFAIIRCGYGNNIVSQDDNYFHRNANICTELNIPFGVYLYSYATNLTMAQSEVEHTLRLIKDYKLEYPVFLDVEDKSQLALPKEELVNIVKYYCNALEEAGYYVGIYANLNTLNNNLNSPELNPYDKWVAQWNSTLTYKGKAGMWQNTNNAIIPGVPTRVDGDIAFYDYPKIIKENGLNHFPKEEPDNPDDNNNPKPEITLKYQVNEEVYLNGYTYNNENAEKKNKKYKNRFVKIIRTITDKKVEAPYELNIGGYAKEEELSKEPIKKENIFCRFLKFLCNLCHRI